MPKSQTTTRYLAPRDPYQRFAFGYWAWMNWRLQQLESAAWREWWGW